MPRFRKKPVEVDAVQVRWSTWGDVCEFIGDRAFQDANPHGGRTISADEASDTCGEPGPIYISFEIRTTHGELATVRHGDWLIPDSKAGTFYPCKPDVFTRTYDEVV
jgi:hypothetical protein